MADVRVLVGRRSRQSGTAVGVQVSTFGMERLAAGVNGEALADILLEAGQPALQQAVGEWPVQTGASRDSIDLVVMEVSLRSARVALQVGGEVLRNDPRNKSGQDYAPFIEFNGSPLGRGQDTIKRAVYENDSDIRLRIHAGVKILVETLSNGTE